MRHTIWIALAFVASGCVSDNAAMGPGDDLARYDGLVEDLAANRTMLLGERADRASPVGAHVYWYEYPTDEPTLHRQALDGGARLDYDIPIPEGVQFDGDVVITVFAPDGGGGGQVRYVTYDADAPATSLGEVTFAPPTDEQRWWAFAVHGGAGYAIKSDEDHALYRWRPGDVPDKQLPLDELGHEIGVLWDFSLTDRWLVYVDLGAIFAVERTSKTLVRIGNPTQARPPVHAADDGILYATSDTIGYFDLSGMQLRDLGAEIEASDYRLSASHAPAHLVTKDGPRATRHGRWVVYEATSGLFAYHLDTGAIEPVLLSPRSQPGELRVDYRDPQFAADGRLIVQALESTSGAIGADGPVYLVEHPLFTD